MKEDKQKQVRMNSKKFIQLKFWIPFLLIAVLSFTILAIDKNTSIGWAVSIILLIVMLFMRNKILNFKWIFRFGSWLLIIIALGFLTIYTYPCPINRSAEPFGKSTVTETIRTENGLISGVYNSDKSVKIFAGLPYAAPPVGNLRWKTPQPVKSWSGVKVADHFSNCAMQNETPTIIKQLYYSRLGTDALSDAAIKSNEPVSEDCLYLNVWTSTKSNINNRPVIVYIHGGSFTSGSGSIDIYNGESMAKKGAVFVTINYRVGIFGFMSHPELTKESGYNASGNYGILDQIAALKWVKRNIEAFGGDPNNVTVAGESAGSMSVSVLVASPLAKGLFQHAIGESGAIFGSRGVKGGPSLTLKEAENVGVKFATTQNKNSIEELRNMSAKELLKASKNVSTRPIIDGYVLPDTIYNIFAKGKQNDVPILIGSNANEGALFTTLPWPENGAVSAEKFKEQVITTYKDKADEFLKLFPCNNEDEAIKSQVDSGTDQCFSWHMHTWAKLQTETGKSKAYLYYFNHAQPGPATWKELGATHGFEIPYAYDNLRLFDLQFTEADKKIANIMSSYWFNFAKTGNPNGDSLPQWTCYNEKSDKVMSIGDYIGTIPTPHKENLKFFDEYEARLRNN